MNTQMLKADNLHTEIGFQAIVHPLRKLKKGKSCPCNGLSLKSYEANVKIN